MPRFLIDNTPPTFVFQDGNQLTDGMANFGRALVQAPLAAAQIRQEHQRYDDQIVRQNRLDSLNQLWHTQGRQDQLDARVQEQQRWQAGQDRMTQADAINNAFKFGIVPQRSDAVTAPSEQEQALWQAAQVGKDQRDAARRHQQMQELGMLFRGHGSSINGGTGWHSGKDANGNVVWFRNLPDGSMVQYDPSTKTSTKIGPDGVPVDAAAPVGGNESTAAPSTGWPLAPTVAGGAALGAGGVVAGKKIAGALAARGGAAAAPVTAPAGGAVGRVFSAARPVLAGAGRVAGALASAPVAIGAAGAYGAYEANQATRADLNPVEGDHLAVLKAYAEGKSIDPGWATKFGKAITTIPTWMGGSGERTSQALDRIQGRHADELVQALAIAIPEGDPNKSRILAQVQQDAWQNPARAQQLVAAIYNNLAARPTGN